MKKDKFVKGKEEIEYKERLKAFMAIVNPKPDLKTLEKMRVEYLKNRK